MVLVVLVASLAATAAGISREMNVSNIGDIPFSANGTTFIRRFQ
jgi:hypothetical protein